MKLIFKTITLLLMSLICYLSVAADVTEKPKEEEQKWWEKRYERRRYSISAQCSYRHY